MIVIIDYGTGNLKSIANMIDYMGFESIFTRNPEEILSASHIILPGVGSFDRGMRTIRELGLYDVLNEAVLEKKIPILGICLGLQLMCTSSEEGNESGFGWLNYNVVRFKQTEYPVPQMGWNYVQAHADSRLIPESTKEKFYFVHGFHLSGNDPDANSGTANYGYDFVCMSEKNNVFGVQFHPEKSHSFGERILRNFLTFNHVIA